MGAHSRRDFIKHTIAGAGLAVGGFAGLAASASSARGSSSPVADRPNRRAPGASVGARSEFALGVATYSLREFSRAEAIEMINALNATNVSVKSFHLDYDLSQSELESAADEFREAGLQLVSSGNNTITEDTDEHVGAFFEYAKAAGIPMLVIAPTPDVLPRIESFVKRYDIQVAIHNHGPEDSYFPAPSDAIALIGDMDPRVGVCVDVGHTARTGKDVVREIRDAGSRVLDVHMKDLRDMSDAASQCAVGEGKMPVADIFRELEAIGFDGSVNLEYEIYPEDPLPGMKQSFAYMRGVRDGLSE